MEIIRYESCQRSNPHISHEVSIYLPSWDLELHRLVEFTKGENRWISYPVYGREEEEGKKFYPYFHFRKKENSDRFLKKVRELVKGGKHD